jgi:hypothetical protein
MLPSEHLPKKVSDKSFDKLTRKFYEVQVKEGGRCKILFAGQDLETKEWYYIYLPIKSFGGDAL